MTPLKLIVDNSLTTERRDRLLSKAVQAYWQARQGGRRPNYEDAAIEFLTPLRTNSPRGLAQKAQILESMAQSRRSAEEIAQFAASIADDALCVSRAYLRQAK